jgi:hypothetical protein
MPYPMKAVKGYVNSKPGIQVGTKWEGKISKRADGTFEGYKRVLEIAGSDHNSHK